uniref:YqaJ viral recombinase domain-containing protein n=1 Tax=viral metagenome TaxID=1070528 RepID=A0A6C0DRN0_9ZZZZ
MDNNDSSDYIPDNDSDAETSESDNPTNKSVSQLLNYLKTNVIVNCTEDDYVDIVVDIFENIQDYMQESMIRISSPDFYKNLISDITEIFYDYWLDADLCHDDDYDDVKELVENVVEVYLDFSGDIPRSQKYDSLNQQLILTPNDVQKLTEKIEHLNKIPQPTQRTKEWYDFRYNLITASSVWKALSSQANKNSIIYEKCKPLTYSLGSMQTNVTSTLHWGVKYEPLSVMIYEDMFQTHIGDFGCIPHSTYDFIGASPDGINIDKTNPVRYGRMLEIKNIFNREITGIPKEEYWIQTQVQMETCDLDSCDFFETRFKEYQSNADFYNDEEHEYKGIILYFIQKTGGFGIDISNVQIYNNSPKYVYMPLSIEKTEDAIQQWVDNTREELKNEYTLYSTIYWYLDEYSCVLIDRNRQWFESALPQIREIWETIVKERVDGYEHRAAKKHANKTVTVENNKDTNTQIIHNMPLKRPVCLVKLDSCA